MALDGTHEALPERVPPICEHCYCPVEIDRWAAAVITHTWPGTFGIGVFLHRECALILTARSSRIVRRPGGEQ